jgi:hypothetical protein
VLQRRRTFRKELGGEVSGSQIGQLVDELILLSDIIVADPPRLPLADHVHRLLSCNPSPRCSELAKALLGLHASFDRAMNLLQEVVQIWDRSMSAAPEHIPQPESRRGRDRSPLCGYERFFPRSAQRFFIASDRRFLPSGVIPPRRRPDVGVPAARVFLAVDDDALPSSALIARSIRFRSAVSSDKIFCRSKVRSSHLADCLKRLYS